MRKRQILLNAILAAIQVFVVSIVLFVLYRFLLKVIGVENLGIWSLVLAITSLAQIASFGLSESVIRYVATFLAREEHTNVSVVIQTGTIAVGIISGFILLAVYPLSKWVLQLFIPADSMKIAAEILPFTLLAMWFWLVASIFHGGLDGCQRIDIRSIIIIVGSLSNLFLCFMLAPEYGLMGVAYARLAQQSVLFLMGWLLLKRHIKKLPLVPYRFDIKLFKTIVNYGFNFQLITATSIFFDPVTKALMSKFSGLSMVGYYEMASKMVQQIRLLIVSANQVVIPAIAELKERTPEIIRPVYLTSYQLLYYLALLIFSILIVCTPIISLLWIGHFERIFVVFSIMLSLGWFLNTTSMPAYYSYFGIGYVRWNVIGHIIMSLSNVILGFLLGMTFGGIGVVTAWIISLILGSAIIFLTYNHRCGVLFVDLFTGKNILIFFSCVVGISTTLVLNRIFRGRLEMMTINVINIVVFLLIILFPFWNHPMRRKLKDWFHFELLKKEK